jgi:hypothetical protein
MYLFAHPQNQKPLDTTTRKKGTCENFILVGRLGNGLDKWLAIDERPGLTNGV